jgi:peptide methionine sulfoxide reductase msrA/msrB
MTKKIKLSALFLLTIISTELLSNKNYNLTAEENNMEIKKPAPEKIKEMLTPLQYKVTQEDGTEAPFNNEYWDNKKDGIYVDVVTGEPLFSSLDKYDSGTGWPSFTKPINQDSIKTKTDSKFFTTRTEVRSNIGDSHLGHVFNDGPKDKGGNRFCMNSSSLKFIPVNELESSGYGEFLSLFSDKSINPKEDVSANKSTQPQEIVLAGGCFWGMEELLRKEKGVLEIEVGYAGGDPNSVTYNLVKTGTTGNAESVRIKYDPTQLNLENLLEYFFKIHDPTTLNRQGNDVGSQYRSAIFTTTEEQVEIAKKVKNKVQSSGVWKKDLTTEISPLNGFTKAEDYHQDYLQKNPGGYTCHFVRDLDF